MNSGAFGEGFPYSNFHDLNMDWIIKIAKDFLDQYTHIQDVIAQGLQNIDDKTQEGVQGLNDLAHTLEQRLNDWYDSHSEDIANQLTDALTDLNQWYTTHQAFLDQYVTTTLHSFEGQTQEIVQETLESLPPEYSNLSYSNLNDIAKLISVQTGKATTQYCEGFEPVQNGYMNADGTISSATAHKVIRLKDTTIKHIILPIFSEPLQINIPTIIVKKDNTVLEYVIDNGTTAYDYRIPDVQFTDIFINWWGANTTPFFSTADISYDSMALSKYLSNGVNVASAPWYDLLGTTKTMKLSDMFGLADGYLSNDMRHPVTSIHQHILIPSLYIRKIQFPQHDSVAVPIAYWYKNETTAGNGLITGTGTEWEFDYPYYGYVGLNYFRSVIDNYPDEVTITFWDKKDVDLRPLYYHSTRKGFNFQNKVACYVGDSICVGHTSGTTVTEAFRYPKLFSEKVGFASYTMLAQAGACIVTGANAVTSVFQQIQSIATPPDFLIVEGGTNDYTLGVTTANFKATMNAICDYITTNMPNTEVIFLTPIPQAKTVEEQIESGYTGIFCPLKNYQRIMTECVQAKDVGKFSVVQGDLFGFPDYESKAEYISTMFGDKVHPSEKGYRSLFFKGLCSALL